MNLGRKLLIIGGTIVGLSYVPLLLMMFGYYPTMMLMQETSVNSDMFSTSSGFMPFIQIFTYSGFALLMAGATYRFWRKRK